VAQAPPKGLFQSLFGFFFQLFLVFVPDVPHNLPGKVKKLS
jgi:hypothetical protein